MHISIYLSIYLCIYLYLSIYLSIHLFIYLCPFLSTHQFPVCLSIHVSSVITSLSSCQLHVCLPVYLPVYTFVCMRVLAYFYLRQYMTTSMLVGTHHPIRGYVRRTHTPLSTTIEQIRVLGADLKWADPTVLGHVLTSSTSNRDTKLPVRWLVLAGLTTQTYGNRWAEIDSAGLECWSTPQ